MGLSDPWHYRLFCGFPVTLCAFLRTKRPETPYFYLMYEFHHEFRQEKRLLSALSILALVVSGGLSLL